MKWAAERAARADGGGDFAASVIEGLSRPDKALPCRFFYDARGSALFEEITLLPEYYPTRTEIAILEAYAQDMVEGRGDGALVEFGSGSSRKTEILLDCMPQVSAYLPVDVSISALNDAKRRLEQRYPRLAVRPLIGDFARGVVFPGDLLHQEKLGFFPGSTIGNFAPPEAIDLLRVMRRALEPGGVLIIGVDLKKDARQLVRAYNDSRGVTAAFNLNLLERLNRELDASFDVCAFRHEAIYDPFEGRVEMRLVSIKDQTASAAGASFHFRAGEKIHTENSYKYTIEEFRQLAYSAGWTPSRVWTDESCYFSVHELVAAASETAVARPI